MRNNKIAFQLSMLFLLAGQAAPSRTAGVEEPSTGERACSEGTTQLDSLKCLSWRSAAADRELKDIVQHHMLEVSGRRRSLLLRAQEAWLAYRRANCDAWAEERAGGSMATATEVACMLRMTNSRIAEIRLMYEEPEPPERPPTK